MVCRKLRLLTGLVVGFIRFVYSIVLNSIPDFWPDVGEFRCLDRIWEVFGGCLKAVLEDLWGYIGWLFKQLCCFVWGVRGLFEGCV